MKLLLIIFGLIVACGGAVPRGMPPDDDVPWCLRFQYSDKADRLHTAQACFERETMCTEALGLIVKYGHFGNVEQVGDCEETW